MTRIYFVIALILTLNSMAMTQKNDAYAKVNGLNMYYEIHGSGYNGGTTTLLTNLIS